MLNYTDASGGAARAAVRLQDGLAARGVETAMMVRVKASPDGPAQGPETPWGRAVTRLRWALDKAPLWRYRARDEVPFSTLWFPDRLARRINGLRPDLIHIHWIGHGYMDLASLARLDAPLVWTLHDAWPFTGGCHIPLSCERYRDRCGACPRLGSTREQDLSRRLWERKQRIWPQLDVTLVTPSAWLAGCARASTLLQGRRVEVIPNGLDLDCFRRQDRQAARARFGLPQGVQLILFATASSRRVPHKGFDLLEVALQRLAPERPTAVVTAGTAAMVRSLPAGLAVYPVGDVREDAAMAALYAAADVTVVPSRQENLPQVAVESLACGTPVVAFNTAGIPEVITHQQTGYLATPFDPEALGAGLRWVLADPERYGRLSAAAREKAVRDFGRDRQAARYHALYQERLDAQKEAHAP